MDETFKLCNVSPQVGAGFNRDYWARVEKFTRDLACTTGGDVLVATGPLFLPTKVAGQSTRRTVEVSGGSGGGDGGAGGAGGNRGVGDSFGDEVGANVLASAAEAVSTTAIMTTMAAAATATETATTTTTATAARPATEYEMRYPLLGSAPDLTAVPTHFFKVVLALPPSSSSSSAPIAAAALVLPNAPIPPDTPMEYFVVPLVHLEAAAGLSFFRQGGLGGATRAEFERAEQKFLETRQERLRQPCLITAAAETAGQGASSGPGAGARPELEPGPGLGAKVTVSETARRLGSMLHVCQLTTCALPVDEYARGGTKYKGGPSRRRR